MREIAIFSLVFGFIVGVLGIAIWATGSQIGIEIGESWYLSLIVLAVFVPGLMNILIFVGIMQSDGQYERILALIRGMGMILCGLVYILLIFGRGLSGYVLLTGLILGTVMWWGTLPFEIFRQKHK